MAFKSQRMTHVDGKMHHLGIDEGDIAKTVVLTPDVQEVEEIAALLDESRQTGSYREYLTRTGRKGGVPLSVMSTGNGCMPMAIAVEELNHVGARCLIKVGVGAALQPGVAPGSIMIATGAVRGEGATLEYVSRQYPAIPDVDLTALLVRTARAHGERPATGIFRTHDAYYAETPHTPGGRAKLETWKGYGVELVEHEASSLFVVSSILRLRAAAIYVAGENFTDGTALSGQALDRRLRAVYEIALDAAEKAEAL